MWWRCAAGPVPLGTGHRQQQLEQPHADSISSPGPTRCIRTSQALDLNLQRSVRVLIGCIPMCTDDRMPVLQLESCRHVLSYSRLHS